MFFPERFTEQNAIILFYIKDKIVNSVLHFFSCFDHNLFLLKTLTLLYLNLSRFLPFKVEEAMMVLEDDSPMEAASTPSTPRNLSAWNITIPYIDFYDDDVKRERIPVFCIDVERNDRKAGEASLTRPSVSLTVISERSFCFAAGRFRLSCGVLFCRM